MTIPQAFLTACALAGTALAVPVEMKGDDLCKLLTAEEVSAVTGSAKTATAKDDRCSYSRPSVPAIHLTNSRQETRTEFLDVVKMLKGKSEDGPGGSVLSAVAFELESGEISAAWFMVKDSPLELEFDGGLEPAKARALVQAALK